MEANYWLGKELAQEKFYDFTRAAEHSRQVKAARQGQAAGIIIIKPFTGLEKKAIAEKSPESKESVHNAGLRGN